MALDRSDTAKILGDYRLSDTDTGSPEVQVALLTHRIRSLTEHFKVHRKDFHSRRGLQTLVNQRRNLLRYLKRQSTDRYQSLIKRLELRDSY